MKLLKIKNIFRDLKKISKSSELINEIFKSREIDRIKNNHRHQNPKSLIKYGYKIYSQSDEDGIIREIFSRIGTSNKIFIEFGIGNGLENNTVSLLLDGWTGLWIEASKESVHSINKNLNEIIKAQRLKVENVFINKNNINAIISKNIECEEIDLLSVDIDGNDFHILNSITCIKPRVVVIEYNAKFVPPVLFCIDYNASHKWERDDYFGASLKFLESNLKDYYLVGCNITGTNAFFVRKDLTKDNFFEPFSAENHYEPARYFLIPFPSGHPASYKSVKVNM